MRWTMARLKTLQSRVTTHIQPRLRTDTAQQGESGWSARERLYGNRHARGYGTAWDKLRAQILRRDRHLCQPCYATGRPEPASQVDHIVPKAQGGTDDPNNLQAICKDCHKVKTSKESKGIIN